MNRTNIEWVKNPDGTQGYTHNPMSGCENHTPEGLCLDGLFPCYACKLANGRVKPLYLANTNLAGHAKGGVSKLTVGNKTVLDREGDYADPFYPRFWEHRMYQLRGTGDYDNAYPDRNAYNASREKEKGIFVCDMGDLFGIGIPEDWTKRVLKQCKEFFQHRFYLLTKQPQNLIKFSPFPENCWVGVTVTNMLQRHTAISALNSIIAPIRFLSCEPLLSPLNTTGWQSLSGIDWLIIGACTGTLADMARLVVKYPQLTLTHYKGNIKTAQPKIEWIREIVEAANKAGIPVFLKDNLKPLISAACTIEDRWVWAKDLGYGGLLRQELPKRGQEV